MAKISINLKEGTLNKKEEQNSVIVGIDLGTTNSLVSYIKNGEPITVKDASGKNALVPSIIHFGEGGETIVGDAARKMLIAQPENTIYSVKRLMGKSFGDLSGHQPYFGYKIIEEDKEQLVKIRVEEKFYTPIELSAHILKELKRRVEKELEMEVTRAVITVPAYFNDAQRQATRDAGKLAGLEVLRIVNEPTAASLAYGLGLKPEDQKKIAVYDLGGGTFDISVLQIQNGIFEVLSTNGDTFLGGDDLDRAIMDYWINEYDIIPSELTENKNLSQEIRLAAEEAKKVLSEKDSFETLIQNKKYSIDKNTFETLAQPLINKTLVACENALRDAKLDAEEIDHVILVGGSTRTPLVKKSVGDFFKKAVYDNLNPDEVVAMGAAVQADILAGNNKDILLLDITPLSLGIETVGGLMDTIIPRNTTVPSRAARNYTTSVDGQKNLKIAVYQGERDLVESNRKLGEFILKGIPPMPAGLPKIEIGFILDADGILKVRAKELRSGVVQEVEIHSQYGISEEEMAQMLLDSLQNAEEDMAKRGVLEAINEANNILHSADKFLQQNEAILSEEEKAGIHSKKKELQTAIDGKNKDTIHQMIEAFNEYTAPLAHRALDKNIADAIKGKQL